MLPPHAYSNRYWNQKIVIIGPYPPRLGGISVHIERVTDILRDQKNSVTNLDVAYKNSRLRRWWYLASNLLTTQPETIFYHTLYNSIFEWLITIICAKLCRARLILVEHSPRHLTTKTRLFRATIRWTMHSVDEQIFIGTTTQASYEAYKIPLKNHCIESSFLPPNPAKADELRARYSPELWSFLKGRHPLLVINGSRIIMWHGQDLYGFDKGLALIAKLKQEYPKIGLLCALAQQDNDLYYAQLQNYIRTHCLEEHVYFLGNHAPLWPLLEYTTLFLRPTLSDSEGISIAEALWTKIPAIASNVCTRPAGTILYDINDPAALERVVREQLQHHAPQKNVARERSCTQ